MQELSDKDLLRQYAELDSAAAFETLVARHVNLVYSAAYRKTGNFHAAEEITQAVFIILSKKAPSLRPEVVLSGWLYQAARFTAANFLRNQILRARREHEAFMSPLSMESEPETWPQIVPLLEDAMGRLNEKDRNAILLRFFEGKSFQEVSASLGTTENAAKKRVAYSLEKLRVFFAKRGIHSTADNIGKAISGGSIQIAPVGLAKAISTVALTKGVAASTSTLILAKGALKIMAWTKAKTAIAAGVATALVGAGALLAYHVATAHASAAPAALTDSVPIQIDNADFKPDGNQDGSFTVEVDPDTRRTTNSGPAIHIKGPVSLDGPALVPHPVTPVTPGTTYKKTDNSSSMRYYVTDSSVLYGKHVRITGWLKTKDVQGWVGVFVIIIGTDGRHYQYDDMSDRPIRGTTDWQKIEIVTDLPNDACIIYFGPDLYGPGELWADDFQINLAPRDTPNTDDRNWRINSENDPTAYSETTDFNVTHNGHPTICVSYTPNGPAPRGTTVRYSHDFYGDDSAKYSGHTVRMTGWLKTENVSGGFDPIVLSFAGWNKLIARQHATFRGTHDWTPFAVTCAIPENSEYLRSGFDFLGSGKAWIDTNSIKYEIIK
jgi:RNA polymerase sigma factor (sigma-70 family)